MSPRRSPARAAFWGGFLGGAAWPLARWVLRRGPKALFVAVLLAVVAWQAAPTPVRVLVVALPAVALGVWAWQRYPRRQAAPLWHPRAPITDLFWVYVLWEWRNIDGRVIPKAEVPFRRDAIRHLVYIGKANDVEARFRQHMADKPWWHDHMAVEGHWFGTEAEALAYEAERIRQAAASEWPEDRPRENRQHNPTYDQARCERMRACAW